MPTVFTWFSIAVRFPVTLSTFVFFCMIYVIEVSYGNKPLYWAYIFCKYFLPYEFQIFLPVYYVFCSQLSFLRWSNFPLWRKLFYYFFSYLLYYSGSRKAFWKKWRLIQNSMHEKHKPSEENREECCQQREQHVLHLSSLTSNDLPPRPFLIHTIGLLLLLSGCYGLNICVPDPRHNLYVYILMPKCDSVRR